MPGTGQDLIGATVTHTALLPVLAQVNDFCSSLGTANLLTVPVEVEIRLYLSRCLSVLHLFEPSQKPLYLSKILSGV